MDSPDLAVVIVTFNTRDLVLQCLRSVCEGASAAGSHRVIVVDNGSADGTGAAVRAEFPSVHLIENSANAGPALAFNQGLAGCNDANYVLLMNSDIRVPPNTLRPMVEYLDRHPDVAGVSVQLVNPDGSPQKFRTSYGISLRPRRFNRVFPITFFGTTFHMGLRAMYDEGQIGPFDEQYYFFNEDLDWSIRAYRRGLIFHYLPNLPVVHFNGLGRAQNRYNITSELYRANLYLYTKFFGRSLARLVYRIQQVELLGKLIYLRLAGKENSTDAAAYRSALEAQRRFMGQNAAEPEIV